MQPPDRASPTTCSPRTARRIPRGARRIPRRAPDMRSRTCARYRSYAVRRWVYGGDRRSRRVRSEVSAATATPSFLLCPPPPLPSPPPPLPQSPGHLLRRPRRRPRLSPRRPRPSRARTPSSSQPPQPRRRRRPGRRRRARRGSPAAARPREPGVWPAGRAGESGRRMPPSVPSMLLARRLLGPPYAGGCHVVLCPPCIVSRVCAWLGTS